MCRLVFACVCVHGVCVHEGVCVCVCVCRRARVCDRERECEKACSSRSVCSTPQTDLLSASIFSGTREEKSMKSSDLGVQVREYFLQV